MSGGPVIAVIPARLASGRLPNKVLADLAGRPMVEHVWRRVVAAGVFDRVLIASADDEVLRVALGFGAEVVRTAEARNGTHRVALAARDLGDRAVVNVQADQPFVDPDHLRVVVDLVRRGAAVATLAAPLEGPVEDPARVKVALGPPVRFSRRALGDPPLVHVGIYGFAPGLVVRCAEAPPSPSSVAEDLEQLAWSDAEIPIRVGLVDRVTASVDTAEDLARARRAAGAVI